MSRLHTVNKTAETSQALEDCLRLAAPGDALLLLEDGVYAATSGDLPRRCGELGLKLYALAVDVEARGLGQHLAEGVAIVDETGFVQLCCEADDVSSWF